MNQIFVENIYMAFYILHYIILSAREKLHTNCAFTYNKYFKICHYLILLQKVNAMELKA